MKAQRLLAALLVSACALVSVTSGPAAAGDSANYVSGDTAVIRTGDEAVVDRGFVVCDDGTGTSTGAGGFCVAFGGGDSIHVVDATAGEDVAFQACIDNDGDNVCRNPDTGACADVTFFSHDDDGSFHNPVGPMPTGFTPGCPGGFEGYVVFVCQGVHSAGLTPPHTHPASTGTGTVTTGGEGNGEFCGGTAFSPAAKPYVDERPDATNGGGPNHSSRGHCRGTLAADGANGPQTTLTGQVEATVSATDTAGVFSPTAAINVECELLVDGVSQGTVLSASGTGVAAATAALAVQADPASTFILCSFITVNGESHSRCDAVTVVA